MDDVPAKSMNGFFLQCRSDLSRRHRNELEADHLESHTLGVSGLVLRSGIHQNVYWLSMIDTEDQRYERKDETIRIASHSKFARCR